MLERARDSVWRGGAVAAMLILAAALAGCASTPARGARVMQPGDFKMLAGEWTGSTNVQNATSVAVQGVIQETGAYYLVRAARPGPSSPVR